MQLVVDSQAIQIDDADAPLLAEHPWKVRPIGRSKALRVAWYESIRHEDGKRGVSARQFHRELYPDHAGNISFADGNPFNLRRANLVLHKTVVARLENPYSAAELAALYQDHSIDRLCNEASAKLSRAGSVNEEAVRRWLAECDITPRTAAQEQARQYALDRPRRLEWQRKGRLTHAARAAAGCYPGMAERMRAGARRRDHRRRAAKKAYRTRFLRGNTSLPPNITGVIGGGKRQVCDFCGIVFPVAGLSQRRYAHKFCSHEHFVAWRKATKLKQADVSPGKPRKAGPNMTVVLENRELKNV